MRSFIQEQFDRGQFAPLPSDRIDARVLTGGTAEKVAVPQGAAFVLLSGTGDFFCLFGDIDVVAAVPSADVIDGSAAELNPAGREIPEGVTHLSLVAPADTTVTLSWYGR